MEITIRPRNIQVQEKLKTKLSWRDSWIENGQLNEIVYEDEGSNIAFFYDIKTKRMKPYVNNIEVPVMKNSFDKIKKKIAAMDFPYEIIDEVPNREITISIDENNLASVESIFENSKFCDLEINSK